MGVTADWLEFGGEYKTGPDFERLSLAWVLQSDRSAHALEDRV